MAEKSKGKNRRSSAEGISGRLPNDPTTKWARDVVDGKIVSGEIVRYAAERHLKDIIDGVARGLHWVPGKAEHAFGFFPAVLSITEGAKVGEPFNLLPWHTFCVGNLFGWRMDSGRMRFRSGWLESGKGQAKALDIDTPIPTPSGWTTMGALVDGDVVFGADGKPCLVTKAHRTVTGQKCYRVTFDDGSEVVANAGHLWRTEMRKSGATGHGDATRGVKLSKRGAWRHGVRTTDEIARTLRYANGPYSSANHSVRLADPIDLPDVDLPLPPYALGYWLGDGDSDCSRLTIGDGDADEAAYLLFATGVRIGPRRGQGYRSAGRYAIALLSAVCRDGFGARLKRLGLYGNKHIPPAYLRASIAQRQALLQGLMDTDGTVTNGQCSFTNMNLRLAGDVHELALSLGLKATLVPFKARLYGCDVGEGLRVNFYADGTWPVFGLSRKQERVAPTHSRRRLSADRKIVECEKVESVPVRCITVDSPDSMFLCGRAMIPTHNSPLLAAVGLYMMGYYGIQRAKVYAIGQDKATANVLFKDAAAMCRAPMPDTDPEDRDTLEARGEVIIRGFLDNAFKIEHPDTNSVFQSLANGEAISGPRPTLVAADEIHEFKINSSIETWKRAIAKMPGDALMLLGTNTPASTQIVGTQYSEFYQKVAKGEIRDDEAFAFIARVDRADQEKVFDNEECWRKSLPALDITFPIENIRGEVNTARSLLSTAMSVKRLYFGIPTGSADFWIAEESWAAVQGHVDVQSLRKCKCWLSLDLSQKNDLTALTAVWLDEFGHLWAKTWYWTTKDKIADRARADNAPYEEWVADPTIDLEAVSGAVIDKTFVAAKVKELLSENEAIEFLAFDPAGIADFIAACEQIGFPVWKWEGKDKPDGHGLKLVSHAQGTRIIFEDKQLCMPRSVERLEDRILTKRITIDASPVTYWCAGNALLVADGQKNRAFDKKRSRGRIDGLVTIAMAVGAATNELADGPDMSGFLSAPLIA